MAPRLHSLPHPWTEQDSKLIKKDEVIKEEEGARRKLSLSCTKQRPELDYSLVRVKTQMKAAGGDAANMKM